MIRQRLGVEAECPKKREELPPCHARDSAGVAAAAAAAAIVVLLLPAPTSCIVLLLVQHPLELERSSNSM